MKNIIAIVITVLILLVIISGLIVKDKVPENSIDYTEKMFITKVVDYTPLQFAFTFLGQKEKFTDGTSNPIILSMYKDFADWVTDSEVPWCSAYMNSIYASTGYEYTGKLNARSWLKVGYKVDNPKPGDVVVFWRESPSSWKGHVGIYLNTTIDNNYIVVLGGNQSNMVKISNYPKNRLLEYRRLRKLSEIYGVNSAFAQQDTIILDLVSDTSFIAQ